MTNVITSLKKIWGENVHGLSQDHNYFYFQHLRYSLNKSRLRYWASLLGAISAFCFLVSRFLLVLILLISYLLPLTTEMYASDMKAKLNTSDGSTSFEFRDSADAVVARVNSDGDALFLGSVTVRGAGGITSGQGNLDLRAPADLHLKYGDTGGNVYICSGGNCNLTVTRMVSASSFSATDTASTSTFAGGVEFQKIARWGTSNYPYSYADGSSGWLRFIPGSVSGGWVFRNSADNSDVATMDSPGNLVLAGSATVRGASGLRVEGSVYMGNQPTRYLSDDATNGAIAFSSSARINGGDLQVTGTGRLNFTQGGATYLKENFGVEVNGSATQPLQVTNASLVLGDAGGSNYSTGRFYPGTDTNRYITDDATNGEIDISSSVRVTGNLYGTSSNWMFMPVVVASMSFVDDWYNVTDQTTYTDVEGMIVTLTVPFAPATIFAMGSLTHNSDNGGAAGGAIVITNLQIDSTIVSRARAEGHTAADDSNATNSMFGLKRVTVAGTYTIKVQFQITDNSVRDHWNGERSLVAYALPSQ